jgi:hypothetical protein
MDRVQLASVTRARDDCLHTLGRLAKRISVGGHIRWSAAARWCHMPLVTYDEFMSRPFSERLTVFNQITAEDRAHLVQAHLTRWITREKSRLSPEQLGVLEEAVTAIKPAWYRRPKAAGTREALMELEQRVAQVLSREDMMQALTIRAEHIPGE